MNQYNIKSIYIFMLRVRLKKEKKKKKRGGGGGGEEEDRCWLLVPQKRTLKTCNLHTTLKVHCSQNSGRFSQVHYIFIIQIYRTKRVLHSDYTNKKEICKSKRLKLKTYQIQKKICSFKIKVSSWCKLTGKVTRAEPKNAPPPPPPPPPMSQHGLRGFF